jgi:hypothetical protein
MAIARVNPSVKGDNGKGKDYGFAYKELEIIEGITVSDTRIPSLRVLIKDAPEDNDSPVIYLSADAALAAGLALIRYARNYG